MTPIFTVVLPITLTNRNDGQGGHWRETHRWRNDFELLLCTKMRTPFAMCADLRITRMLVKGERLWDADSIGRGNAKQLLDALVSLGWFHDDGPKWIRNCDFRQDVSQRAKLRQGMTRVEVFEIED